MDYELRFRSRFFAQLMLIPLYSWIFIFRPYQHHEYVWLIIGLIFTPIVLSSFRPITLIKLIIYKKPVLTVNQSYVFDHFQNIQYYWDDIEEAVQTDNTLY